MDTPSGLLQGGGCVLDVVVRALLVHAHLPHQRPLTQSDWSQPGGGRRGGGRGGDKVTRYIHVHTLALSDSTQSVKVPTHKITICLMLNIAVTLLD